MNNQKKSFALLLTILLMTTFSFLSIYILELKTLQSDSQTKLYKKIQADFHMKFLEDFVNNFNFNKTNTSCVNTIKINDDNYQIYANISYISKKTDCLNSSNINFDETYTSGLVIIDLYVKSKSSIFSIKLHKRVLRKL